MPKVPGFSHSVGIHTNAHLTAKDKKTPAMTPVFSGLPRNDDQDRFFSNSSWPV
jgi:hypothetical protein